MKKLLLFLGFLLIMPGCKNKSETYPKRPAKTPYYYNEISITEMDQNVRFALRGARERTGIEFVTAILKKIPRDFTPQQYAAGLFDHWEIGKNTNAKGILILFIEDTHTLKIEVSYELEGIFTDLFCSMFQPEIKSYYAGSYFGDAFCHLVTCFEERFFKGPNFVLAVPSYEISEDDNLLISNQQFLSGGAGILDDEYYHEKETKLSFIKYITPEKQKQFNAAKSVDVVIDRYLKMMEQGISYPFLDMLTQGSQLMRLEYPESKYFHRARWYDYQRALPYKIYYEGNLAVARFQNADPLPIFLRRDQKGYWRIDVPKAWAYCWMNFVENKSGLIYRDHPYMFAFSEYSNRNSNCLVPSLKGPDFNIRSEIEKLETAIKTQPNNPENYFNLADIFLWECYWLRATIDLLEKALELQPQNTYYRWLLIDTRYRFPNPQPNAEHFEQLIKYDPQNLKTYTQYSRHCWDYTMQHKKAIRLLRKAKKIENKIAYGNVAYKWYLNYFKKNYWNQLYLDRSKLFRSANYFYIFYWNWLTACFIITPILLTASFVAYKVLSKRKTDSARNNPHSKTKRKIPNAAIYL